MKANKYILCGIVGMMMAACGSEEMTIQPQGDNIVKLTTKIEGMVATRVAASDYLMNTQFISGRPLNVYIVDHETQEGIAGTSEANGGQGYVQYTTGGDGSMTTPTAPTYPANSTIDVYALHGINKSFSGVNLFGSGTGIDWLYSSDIMYALAKDVDNTGGTPVELTFHHVCSKVKITLDPGTTNKSLEGAKVKGYFYPAINVTENSVENGLVLSVTDNTSNTFDPFTLGDYADGGIVFILGPQKRYPDATKPMFSVETSDGMVYNYFPQEAVSFESGKAYTYNLKLSDKLLLEVSSTVEPWDGNTTIINGDAKQ